MTDRTLRGKVAIAGIGESLYYKRGKSPLPEFKLALQAILAAAEDAGIEVREIDGFASYADEQSVPSRLARWQLEWRIVWLFTVQSRAGSFAGAPGWPEIKRSRAIRHCGFRMD